MGIGTVFWGLRAVLVMTMVKAVMEGDSAKYGQNRGKIGRLRVSHLLENAVLLEVRSVSRL